jgi:hypothetical protein
MARLRTTRAAAKRALKQIDSRVEQAYYASCEGIQINIMDIGKVFKVGREAIRDGVDDALLQSTIRKFVDQIKKN